MDETDRKTAQNDVCMTFQYPPTERILTLISILTSCVLIRGDAHRAFVISAVSKCTYAYMARQPCMQRLDFCYA